MKLKFNKKQLLQYCPLAIAIAVFITVFISLQLFNIEETLISMRESYVIIIITVSGIIATLLVAFLISKISELKKEKSEKMPELNALTQKLHKFRQITNKLLHSNMWNDKLKGTINRKYKQLSYFDVNSNNSFEQAKKFINDHSINDSKYLFLELKSFENENMPFDETLLSEFEVSRYYPTSILENWKTNHCGNGLWYYFEDKREAFKGCFKLFAVNQLVQNEIKQLAVKIDKERYKNCDFGYELLAKLGTQIDSDILPNLYSLQVSIEYKPKIINFLWLVLSILIGFGILLPLFSILFSFPLFFDAVSVSVIVSLIVYIILASKGVLNDN
jgi:hypothetical protein